MEFKKYKLCDLLETKTQGVNTTTDNIKYVDRGIKIIQAKNISKYNFTFDNENYVSEKTYSNMRENHKLHNGEVLFTNIGSQLGNSVVYDSEDPAIITWNVLKLIPNHLINNYFLCYYLNYKSNYIKTLNSSSTMPFVSGQVLLNMECEIPDMTIQEKIVEIVKNINDKIKLNSKINKNLHELMEINFNDWIENLIDYRESKLTEIATYTNGLAMQKFRPENEKGLPVIKIKEMNNGISADTERCSSNIKEEARVYDGDILFAWSGTLCMSIWCNGNAGLNQHIFKVTSEKYPKWFYYLWTLKHLNKFKLIAEGKATTMGHIQRKELDNSEVKIPSKIELERMDHIMAPLFEKYIVNNVENRNLEQLRDTLLPKLMNGEIDLDSIEV